MSKPLTEAQLKVVAAHHLKAQGFEGRTTIGHCCGTSKGYEVFFVHAETPYRARVLEGELFELETLATRADEE